MEQMQQIIQQQADAIAQLREALQQQQQAAQATTHIKDTDELVAQIKLLGNQVASRRENFDGVMDTKMLHKVKPFDGTRKGW